jgi:hypothetical protein
LLASFTLPCENDGGAFDLGFETFCWFVSAEVAVEGLSGDEAGR